MASRMKIRADDNVVVISGKDKGKTGRVLEVDPKRERVYVEGLNIVKRHQRPRVGGPNSDPGGVIERPGPIHISNVMLLDPQENKPTRIRVVREDGKRYRVSKLTGERID